MPSVVETPRRPLMAPRDQVWLAAGTATVLVVVGAFATSLWSDSSRSDGAVREWLLLVSLAVASGAALIGFKRLAYARALAVETARVDPLTLLPNRVATEEHLRRVSASAARHGTSYGVLLVDVDPFKSVNDTYGHGHEDDVLAELASTLSSSARRSDFVSRWGGEEFLIVVTSVDRDQLVAAAERFRLCAGAVRQDSGGGRVVTVSIGGAIGRSADAAPTIATADAALYTAKAAGRNCAVIAEDRHRDSAPVVADGTSTA